MDIEKMTQKGRDQIKIIPKLREKYGVESFANADIDIVYDKGILTFKSGK